MRNKAIAKNLRCLANIGLIITLLNSCDNSKSVDIDTTYNALSTNTYIGDTLQASERYWKERARKMVDEQIRARGVTDLRVLKAMEETPRHLFVPKYNRANAYDDYPLSIGEGQTISQPYIVAFMTELLTLKGNERVLEIGTGSGYQAAILAQLVKEVFSIEIIKTLADSSRIRLRQMGYDNVAVKWGDGYRGWSEYAPFDAIILTAAPTKIPPMLVKQLKPGGKMVLPVGGRYFQLLKVITKTSDGKIKENTVTMVGFVPMVHPVDSVFEK